MTAHRFPSSRAKTVRNDMRILKAVAWLLGVVGFASIGFTEHHRWITWSLLGIAFVLGFAALVYEERADNDDGT